MKIIKYISAFIFIVLIARVSFASNKDVFNIKNIKVDITDISAVKAKKKAVEESQKIAFNTLVKRISMLNDNDIIALNVSTREIDSLLYDFYISDERRSDVRYKGTFNFTFNPKKTSRFLNEKEVAFTSIKSSPVLIIPVWVKENGNALLWEDNNIWKRSWEVFPSESFLVPTQVPFGDLEDISSMPMKDLLTDNIENIDSILNRYGVRDIVVVVAAKEGSGLLVHINRHGLNGVSSKNSIFVEGKDKTYGEVLSESVDKVASELGKMWKEKTLTSHEELSYIEAKAKIDSIENLQKLKKLLNNITIINTAKENILTHKEVSFDVYYQGSFFDFKLALSQLGITAEKTDVYNCNLIWEN